MAQNAETKLYLTADRERVVEEGDPDAAFLFKGEGDEITDEEAKQYGIGARAEEQTDPVQKARQEAQAAETKQAEPAQNKAVTTAANKRR